MFLRERNNVQMLRASLSETSGISHITLTQLPTLMSDIVLFREYHAKTTS